MRKVLLTRDKSTTWHQRLLFTSGRLPEIDRLSLCDPLGDARLHGLPKWRPESNVSNWRCENDTNRSFFCCSYFRCLKVYRYHSFVFLIIIRWKKTITCGVLLSNPKSIWNLKTGYAAQMFGLKKIFECYCLMESFRSATFFFLFSALSAYFNYSFKFNNFSFTINMNSLSIVNRFFIWGKKSASQLILCLKKRKFLEWNSGKVIRMSDIRITVPDSFILPLSIDRSYDNIC